jgi:hypothetical protein
MGRREWDEVWLAGGRATCCQPPWNLPGKGGWVVSQQLLPAALPTASWPSQRKAAATSAHTRCRLHTSALRGGGGIHNAVGQHAAAVAKLYIRVSTCRLGHRTGHTGLAPNPQLHLPAAKAAVTLPSSGPADGTSATCQGSPPAAAWRRWAFECQRRTAQPSGQPPGTHVR